jgi:hypothetical protein
MSAKVILLKKEKFCRSDPSEGQVHDRIRV